MPLSTNSCGEPENVPFIVDVQAALLRDLRTRIVIPLLPRSHVKGEVMPRLKPVVQIKGKSYILMTSDLAAITTSDLGKLVENIESQRQVIVEAIDFLLQGF